MDLEREITIHVSAKSAWILLGERFGHIGEWAAPITASSLDGAPVVGSVRTCHTARFGPVPAGVIKERLLAFEPANMSLTYEATAGLPKFIVRATNQWSVHPIDAATCMVRSRATVELRGPMALLGPLLKRKMQADGGRVLEELKHHLEQGRPHPRKVATSERPA